jgi:hypothetical protein
MQRCQIQKPPKSVWLRNKGIGRKVHIFQRPMSPWDHLQTAEVVSHFFIGVCCPWKFLLRKFFYRYFWIFGQSVVFIFGQIGFEQKPPSLVLLLLLLIFLFTPFLSRGSSERLLPFPGFRAGWPDEFAGEKSPKMQPNQIFVKVNASSKYNFVLGTCI